MPETFYRVFLYQSTQKNPREKGGALFLPREYQGGGRHDISEDGILYASVEPVAAVCENLKRFRNLEIDDRDLARPDGLRMALVKLGLDTRRLIDLRAAQTLVKLKLAPAEIATSERRTTQKISRTIYEYGADGFFWWSTLEAKWSNVSLFYSRVSKRLKVLEPPVVLDVENRVVVDAARHLNIRLR